jgi:spore cortex formation protein SpoVR/YcgB (stage V sporulation)
MSRLEIILSAILTISVILNIGIFVYARASIARLLFVSEELGDLQQMVNSFSGHLDSVYSLESFYGDQTLKNLLDHAISFNEQLETFEFIYSLTEQEQQEDLLNDRKKENTPPKTPPAS